MNQSGHHFFLVTLIIVGSYLIVLFNNSRKIYQPEKRTHIYSSGPVIPKTWFVAVLIANTDQHSLLLHNCLHDFFRRGPKEPWKKELASESPSCCKPSARFVAGWLTAGWTESHCESRTHVWANSERVATNKPHRAAVRYTQWDSY